MDRPWVQFKTPDSSAQNRESQRRSRARRRELIDDLSRQLEEYKRRGVQASLDMQRAARAVFDENRRLRALLRLHGVSTSDVGHYLASSVSAGHDQTVEGPMASSRIEPMHRAKTWSATRSRLTPAAATGLGIRAVASKETPAALALSPSSTMRSLDKERHQRQAEIKGDCQRSDYEDNFHPDQPWRFTDGVLPPVSDCFCPPGPSANDGDRTEVLETSCEAAAAILVELHDQADLGRARVALGCNGESNCFVKNTTIFRLMDELN